MKQCHFRENSPRFPNYWSKYHFKDRALEIRNADWVEEVRVFFKFTSKNPKKASFSKSCLFGFTQQLQNGMKIF